MTPRLPFAPQAQGTAILMLRVIGCALRWWLGQPPAEMRDGAAAVASVNQALEDHLRDGGL